VRSLPYCYSIPYCVPYWNHETYHVIFKRILSGRVIDGPDTECLKDRLAKYFQVPEVIPCGRGRVAIELALRASGIKEGDEVVVPSFCCPSVIPPVLATGAEPALADVGDDLIVTAESVERAFTHRTRAVIVPHLFGNPADIEPIVDYCRRKEVIVIDDAAQALGATWNGRPLGTFGDAGLVSFGNGKICFGTGGGVLVSRNPSILEKAKRIPVSRGSLRGGISDALSTLVWRRWRRWSLPLKVGLSKAGLTMETARTYSREGMRNLDAAVALTLLDTLAENLHARRARVDAYRAFLKEETRLSLIPHRAGSACLTQVARVNQSDFDGSAVDRIIRVLREKGFEVGRSYRPLHLAPEYRKFARVPLEKSDHEWQNLLEFPCEPSVPLSEVKRICKIVTSNLGR